MYNYCKTCRHDDGDIGFCDKCYYNHILEEKGIPPTEYEAKPKPQTNADKLRAMSDEELAEWLATVPMSYEDVCPNPIPKECNGGDRETCIQCWLDWLRQEASDG